MIKEKLLELPHDISKLRLEMIEAENKQEKVRENIRVWEAREIIAISNEVDEKGKAVHSNEAKRKAALEEAKNDSEEYIELQKALNKAEIEVKLMQIQLDRLYNEQSNLRAICRLEGRE